MKGKYKRITVDIRVFEDREKEMEDKIRDIIEERFKGAYCVWIKSEDVTEDYKDLTTVEYCRHCNDEVTVSANGISKCPQCGNVVLPCSMCVSCVEDCPYTEGYEKLYTFPEEDAHYSKDFYVPKKWLKRNIGKSYKNVEEFKDCYTWDESYFLMMKAQKDGVYLTV